eukprot:9501522-Pyramimonas_sp.AAC.1
MAHPRLTRHPSDASWPHGSSTEGPSSAVRMACTRPIRHTFHTIRGPIGSSTEGPSGTVRMAYPHPTRHTPHALRGP